MLQVASTRASYKPPPFVTKSDGVDAPFAQRLVLVVDDYEDTRALYATHFEEAGFRVVEAAEGEEAVRVARETKPDAIIMDLSMPKLDGWDATRQIRAALAGRDVYIVALSAFDGDASRALAFDAGCDDFISKPLLPAALIAVVRARFAK